MAKSLVVVSFLIFSWAVFVIPSKASTKELLYVAGPQGSSNVMLNTYSVDPTTAAATQVGNPVNVAGGSLIPLTIGTSHYLYLWNKTGVSLYQTHADGSPLSTPSQQFTFAFPLPINTFLINPNGRFAYAALGGLDSVDNQSKIVLFTIDQSTGQLTNTDKVVASYSNEYTGFLSFQFGQNGSTLFAYYWDSGPYTFIVGYDYYPVNQTTGALESLHKIFNAQTGECGTTCAVTVTDVLSAQDGACCGPPSGFLAVTVTSEGKSIGCAASETFCTDDVANLAIDPANANVFFGDRTANETYIMNVDFSARQLVASSSTIPGTPSIYFSPDSRIMFAVNQNDLGIYALQTATGTLTASTTLPDPGDVSIATAALGE